MNPPPYFIVLASSVKIKEAEVIAWVSQNQDQLKLNVKVKYDFSRNEARNKCYCVIPHFHVILAGQSISETILII